MLFRSGVTNHLYVIDTSAWIAVRRQPRAPQSERTLSLILEGLAAINPIVRLELLVGCRDESEFAETDRELSGLTDFEMLDITWDTAARLGFNLRRKGVTVPVPDLLIAASAIEHEAVVVHADKHFIDIAQHSDLRVESYAEPLP